jgi:two-component SAPR family response regulator
MTYKCVIIDDSSVHRLAISFLIKNHPKLELVGAYSNPYEGMRAVYDHKVDLVFLDVLLEEVNAFELLDTIEMPATIILNSSWEKFSNKAKAYGIERFLVKPMRKEAFEQTINSTLLALEELRIERRLSKLQPFLTRKPNVFQVHESSN